MRALYNSSRSLRVTTLKESRPSSGQTLSSPLTRIEYENYSAPCSSSSPLILSMRRSLFPFIPSLLSLVYTRHVVYVRKCICMMKYSYTFTLRLIYIHFDHQRCLVYLKTISLIIGYIRIAVSTLPILIDSLSTALPISYICVYIHTHINIHI